MLMTCCQINAFYRNNLDGQLTKQWTKTFDHEAALNVSFSLQIHIFESEEIHFYFFILLVWNSCTWGCLSMTSPWVGERQKRKMRKVRRKLRSIRCGWLVLVNVQGRISLDCPSQCCWRRATAVARAIAHRFFKNTFLPTSYWDRKAVRTDFGAMVEPLAALTRNCTLLPVKRAGKCAVQQGTLPCSFPQLLFICLYFFTRSIVKESTVQFIWGMCPVLLSRSRLSQWERRKQNI